MRGPGNRFWPALFASGFTERLLRPDEETELLRSGCGITNIVGRATSAADQLSEDELAEGAKTLEEKIREYKPGTVAVLGVGAYRMAFGKPKAVIGLQPARLAGARLWVLPNPSGLNAHFSPRAFARLFRELRRNAILKP